MEAEFSGKGLSENALNSFADATPALDRDHIYLAWTTPEEYTIVALDQQTGKDAWRRNVGPFADTLVLSHLRTSSLEKPRNRHAPR